MRRHGHPDPLGMAMGNPYVYAGNNPLTQPLSENLWDIPYVVLVDNAAQQNRLASYHFTQSPGDDATTDPATRYRNPGNPQLIRLFDAAAHARDLGSDCAGAVLYGEYLHAFEDSFAHRSYDDTPIGVDLGLGHGISGHLPDHTYNETQLFGHDWLNNEARTLEMEHEVFDRLKSTVGDDKNPSQKWEDIEPLLVDFNATQENSDTTDHFTKQSKKVDMLNAQLNLWGYGFVGVNGKEDGIDLKTIGKGRYDPDTGDTDRKDFLRYSQNSNDHKAGDPFKIIDPAFLGTILP